MKISEKKIIVFAPHPDDDLIGCGGSIARRVSEGEDVMIIYMTSGGSGSLDNDKEKTAQIREEEARQAARVIGIKELRFLRREDGYLSCGKDELIEVTRLIREVRPDVIYVPHKDDAHRDHKATHEIVVEAAKRASAACFPECGPEAWAVKTVYAYEVWTPMQTFSCVEDISDLMDMKIEALQQHKSQIRACRYDDAAKGLARYRGAMTGKGEYCECFCIVNKY